MYDYIIYDSPLGTLTIAAKGDALCALVIANQKYADRHLAGEGHENETPVLCAARRWLDSYFQGKRPDCKELKLSPEGTEFQKTVWKELLNIPYGSAESYGSLARRIRNSPRAVGFAVGHNPISIIIPCHRVLSYNGQLTGYAGGLENKIKLLELEGIRFYN